MCPVRSVTYVSGRSLIQFQAVQGFCRLTGMHRNGASVIKVSYFFARNRAELPNSWWEFSSAKVIRNESTFPVTARIGS